MNKNTILTTTVIAILSILLTIHIQSYNLQLPMINTADNGSPVILIITAIVIFGFFIWCSSFVKSTADYIQNKSG